MNGWFVSYQKDEGYAINLYENYPWWKENLARGFGNLCDLTHGVFMGHGSPEWMWKIPLGYPRRDEEGFLLNSLAGKLMDIENAVFSLDNYHDYVVEKIYVDEEVIRRVAPDFLFMSEG